jgi:predicted phage terminase large subunit-like protein
VIDVFWPAWTWLQDTDFTVLLGAWTQFLHITHREDLATRDSKRCRQLIKSGWYQNLCEGRVQVKPDSDQAAYFAIDGGGSRRAFGIRAALTGHDSDVQVLGDPYDVEGVLSPIERSHAEFVFDEVLPSRFNHPTRNALVLAAQRTHVADLHAHVMAGADWQAGVWRYDCVMGIKEAASPESDPDATVHRPEDFAPGEDPRKAGEVYWPERFTADSLMSLAKTAHAKASQIQQNPQARGAGIFRSANWQFADEAPVGLRLVRYWDKAATAEGAGSDPDYTAGALGAYDRDGRFWLTDMQRGRWASHQVEQRIALVAREIDPLGTQIWIEEEPGSSGKDVTSYYQRHILRGFSVRGDRVTGPKLVRVDAFVAAAEAGNVVIALPKVQRAAFLEECDAFTGDDSTHDDQVIAAVGAFKKSASSGVSHSISLRGV